MWLHLKVKTGTCSHITYVNKPLPRLVRGLLLIPVCNIQYVVSAVRGLLIKKQKTNKQKKPRFNDFAKKHDFMGVLLTSHHHRWTSILLAQAEMPQAGSVIHLVMFANFISHSLTAVTLAVSDRGITLWTLVAKFLLSFRIRLWLIFFLNY